MKHAEGLKLGHHIPVPSCYTNSTWKKKISDVRSGCRRGKNGSGGRSYVNAFLGACRLSHLISVKMNLFPSNLRDLWYAIHTR